MHGRDVLEGSTNCWPKSWCRSEGGQPKSSASGAEMRQIAPAAVSSIARAEAEEEAPSCSTLPVTFCGCWVSSEAEHNSDDHTPPNST